MELLIEDDVKKKMQELHILEEEVKKVIDAGEIGGKKCHNMNNTFLSKLQIEECTYYIQYTPVSKDVFMIHTAYFHRAQIKSGE